MRILVTGACGPAGRSLLTQLHQRGVDAVGVDMAPTPRPDGIPVLAALPASDPAYLTQLDDLVAGLGAHLVIPTVSEELPLVAAAGRPWALIGPADAVVLAADKWLTTQVLSAAGVTVPRTIVADQATDHLRAWIGAPIVTKPRISRGGRGVVVHQAWGPAVPVAADLVASEFVPGVEFAPNVFVADDPAADVAVVLRKTGLKDGVVGNATGVERVDDPVVGAVAVAACRALGLRGPADVDVRLRADGTPVVLEVNARFGANSTHAPELLDAVLACTRAEVTA